MDNVIQKLSDSLVREYEEIYEVSPKIRNYIDEILKNKDLSNLDKSYLGAIILLSSNSE